MIFSFCSWTAGHSRCWNHIAAVKFSYPNQNGYKNSTCTDEICNWNSSLKEIQPIKVKDRGILHTT